MGEHDVEASGEDVRPDLVGCGPGRGRLGRRLELAEGVDRILCGRIAWGIGFAVPGGRFWPAPVYRSGLFGQRGATGSFAFADRERRIAFGYVPKPSGTSRGSELLEGGDFRVRSLIQALCGALEDAG